MQIYIYITVYKSRDFTPLRTEILILKVERLRFFLCYFNEKLFFYVLHIYIFYVIFQVPEVKPNGVAPQARARKVTPAAKKGKVGLNNNNAAGSKAATNGKPQSEAAKARDEARKKMIEDKKRLMKERQQQQQQQQEDTEQVVEMFIPG